MIASSSAQIYSQCKSLFSAHYAPTNEKEKEENAIRKSKENAFNEIPLEILGQH